MATKNVLMVDDDRGFLRMMELAFADAGFITTITDSGHDALEALAESDHCFDLAVLDLSMPEMDGVQLGTLIREKCPSCKIAFLSAAVNPKTLLRIHAMETVGVWEKPVTPGQLCERILEVLG